MSVEILNLSRHTNGVAPSLYSDSIDKLIPVLQKLNILGVQLELKNKKVGVHIDRKERYGFSFEEITIQEATALSVAMAIEETEDVE